MRNRWGSWVAVLGLSAISLLSWAGAEEGKEEKVPLDQLPEVVRKAAQEAVKDIVLTEAEKETKGDAVVYEVDGKVGEKEYEIVISADGKVIKVEEEGKGKEKEEEKD